ncbi:uncharacterized protein LOC142577673 isoform X2 [Dermacentor variabilis]|uniref:uncharacterized protein LOC142577673 isoform X2 n=1 Tax=Dermacentor variabilis TaxID=34621 RepID=UPI003F5BF97F
MVSRLNAVSTVVLFTLLLKIALILFRLLARRGRVYTAVETEEILSGLIRVLILLMSYNFVTSRQTESLSFQSASQFCNQDLWLSGCACNMCTVQRRARTGVCKMNQL